MTFAVGDRVVYSGRHPTYFEQRKIGQYGTILTAVMGLLPQVQWDDVANFPANGCYPENLKLVDLAPDETESYFV